MTVVQKISVTILRDYIERSGQSQVLLTSVITAENLQSYNRLHVYAIYPASLTLVDFNDVVAFSGLSN